MFQKYVSKISNTIGTVQYMRRKSHGSTDKVNKSGRNKRKLSLSTDFDEEMLLNITTSTPYIVIPTTPDIILDAAIKELRETLLYYPLV